MLDRPIAIAMVLGVLTGLGLTGSTAAAPPSLYKGSAQPLIPTAAEAGYEQITSQSGGATKATASYTRGSPGTASAASASITVRVFKAEAAARVSLDSAPCDGCAPGSFKTRWKYKLGLQNATDGSRNMTVNIVAQCRNLRADLQRTSGNGRISQTGWARQVTDLIFVKAERLGMTTCGSSNKPPPPTGKWFWTESYAEEIVVRKVRIPGCNVYPDNPQCDRLVGSPFRLRTAQCRGLDEKPGTFTYSRFTCEIVLYNGQARGRLAVWPTGPTTLRWQII